MGLVYTCIKHMQESEPMESHCMGCEIARLKEENKRFHAALQYIADVTLDKRCKKAANDVLVGKSNDQSLSDAYPDHFN